MVRPRLLKGLRPMPSPVWVQQVGLGWRCPGREALLAAMSPSPLPQAGESVDRALVALAESPAPRSSVSWALAVLVALAESPAPRSPVSWALAARLSWRLAWKRPGRSILPHPPRPARFKGLRRRRARFKGLGRRPVTTPTPATAGVRSTSASHQPAATILSLFPKHGPPAVVHGGGAPRLTSRCTPTVRVGSNGIRIVRCT